MGKPKPMTHEEVRRWSKRRLAEIRSADIEFVQVLGCGNTGQDCAACLALKDQNIPIAEAPLLPLPDCDLEHCKCMLIASE